MFSLFSFGLRQSKRASPSEPAGRARAVGAVGEVFCDAMPHCVCFRLCCVASPPSSPAQSPSGERLSASTRHGQATRPSSECPGRLENATWGRHARVEGLSIDDSPLSHALTLSTSLRPLPPSPSPRSDEWKVRHSAPGVARGGSPVPRSQRRASSLTLPSHVLRPSLPTPLSPFAGQDLPLPLLAPFPAQVSGRSWRVGCKRGVRPVARFSSSKSPSLVAPPFPRPHPRRAADSVLPWPLRPPSPPRRSAQARGPGPPSPPSTRPCSAPRGPYLPPQGRVGRGRRPRRRPGPTRGTRLLLLRRRRRRTVEATATMPMPMTTMTTAPRHPPRRPLLRKRAAGARGRGCGGGGGCRPLPLPLPLRRPCRCP
jgi:hypothetical protein